MWSTVNRVVAPHRSHQGRSALTAALSLRHAGSAYGVGPLCRCRAAEAFRSQLRHRLPLRCNRLHLRQGRANLSATLATEVRERQDVSYDERQCVGCSLGLRIPELVQ